ncbi:twin-arginine translocation signal domain-containing protein [Desulfatiglans anilini]|uniref:twin-arginine translocation signal domain-containing protein n=1 Tax=Desulfatiglans anilini TaxID=90728 RepID=UPI0012946859
MAITRRTFLKTAGVGATAASILSAWTMKHSCAASKAKERGFRLSASRVRISLGTRPDDIWAWTCDGKVPGSKIRVREEDDDPDRAEKLSRRKIHYSMARRASP